MTSLRLSYPDHYEILDSILINLVPVPVHVFVREICERVWGKGKFDLREIRDGEWEFERNR